MSSHPNDLVVRLNLEAMNALFPEGSQARVELQQSLLAQTSGRYVKQMLTPELRDVVKVAVDAVTKEIDVPALISEQFARSPHWVGELTLVPGAKAESAIKQAVKAQFDAAIVDLVETSVAAHLETHLQRLEKRVDYEISKRVEKITQDMLTSRVNEAIEAARKALHG